MTRRSYAQYCGLARALDVLGERWTLLAIRELLLGPKRFSDLLDGLPGIGPNVLSTRLRTLEGEGLVRKRRLPPPAASTVYELTDRGRELEPAVVELARWGVGLLGAPGKDDRYRPGWLALSLRAAFRPEAAAGVRRTYRLRVDDEVFTVRVDDGTLDVQPGETAEPDVAIVLDAGTLMEIVGGELSSEEAVASGRVEIEAGDPADALGLAALMLPPAAVAAS
jgi:DNA-binding HxlR family transcriptional regulator/putative sterol carrier protein